MENDMMKQGEKLSHLDLNEMFKDMYKRINSVTPDNLGTITTASFTFNPQKLINTTSNQEVPYASDLTLLKKITTQINELEV